MALFHMQDGGLKKKQNKTTYTYWLNHSNYLLWSQTKPNTLIKNTGYETRHM